MRLAELIMGAGSGLIRWKREITRLAVGMFCFFFGLMSSFFFLNVEMRRVFFFIRGSGVSFCFNTSFDLMLFYLFIFLTIVVVFFCASDPGGRR